MSIAVPPMVEARLRTVISPDELASKVGKIVTDSDYNMLLTGPARLLRPNGTLLAVFVPGVLAPAMDEAAEVLTKIRLDTYNRGKASGSLRSSRPGEKRSASRRILSGTLGAADASMASSRAPGRPLACRLTAWTGTHLPEWRSLRPLLADIADVYRQTVPDRYAVQLARAEATHPDWVIPHTPFTTITINNTYATGIHQDSGDLPDGFSTLAVLRRGPIEGGRLVLPKYRVAVEMRHGDLLLFDAHEWHGNTNMTCPHVEGPMVLPCREAGCARISLVSYFRTRIAECASSEEETAKLVAYADATEYAPDSARRWPTSPQVV